MRTTDVINGTATWAIDNCDVLDGLLALPDNCVHCVVTSPPYWGLRDYGVEGQMGLERTPEQFVENMAIIFNQVKRVLRDDGVCFVNIGDSYNAYNGGAGPGSKLSKRQSKERPALEPGYGLRCQHLKPKDLVGVPWRLAFALQGQGWYLRSEIIWHKRSPMPESVRDRPTKAHEQIFLLTKSERYFYDAFAGSERATGGAPGNTNPGKYAAAADDFRTKQRKHLIPGMDRRNARTVWTLSNESFKGAHFATFPTKLVKKCLLLGTSAKGCCPECGAPWRRIVKKKRVATRPGIAVKADKYRDSPEANDLYRTKPNLDPQRHVTKTKTVGWQPGCECGHADTVRCIVLDPFAGAGTTLMVARRMDLRAIGFELNPTYAAMARKRIADDAPLFNLAPAQRPPAPERET